MDDLKYWVAFARIPSIGTARVRRLEAAFRSLEEAWSAPVEALARAGLEKGPLRQVTTWRPQIDPDAEMERLEQLGGRALTWHDPEYPAALKEIYDPPPVLFVKGRFLERDQRAVAVVGTRSPTVYGREAVAALSRDLAGSGVTIVSGLARGIDGIAHTAALEVGGRTIAVMGSGLDVFYPAEHRALAERVVESGVLMSEHSLGTRPVAQNFPRRNRLLSGLSLGVLGVEGTPKSGAMITVMHALEQGRDVFAVPGSIFSPASRGPNRLVQDGAKLVLDHTDVLEELNLSTLERQASFSDFEAPSGEGNELLEYIGVEPVHIDDVIRRAGLPIPAVSSALALLELRGAVRQVGAMHYVRVRETSGAYQTAG